jgi:membrane protease subunit HflK
MNEQCYPMAWNEPGSGRNGHNNQNPWGNKGNKDQRPPDLEQLFRKFFDKLKSMWRTSNSHRTGGGGNAVIEPQQWGRWALVVTAILVVFYFLAGIYIVDPPERAVVTRFGKYIRTESPGPHWLLPIVESREIVNVEQVATSDHNGLMLTKDRNIASVGIAVQYRIGHGVDDVRAYLYNVANPIHSLKMSAESALRQVVGQSTMDEVLTLRRAEIAVAIKEQLIETLKEYKTGITVIDVATQFAKAPDEVRVAFDDVIKAAADEERLVNLARAYENEVIPRARGTVERLKNEAMGYKQETILISEGNVRRFNSILPEYQKAPRVTQTRLYLDTMEQILSKTTKVVVDSSLGNNLIYLPFDKMPAFNGNAAAASATAPIDPGSTSSNAPIVSSAPSDQKEKN